MANSERWTKLTDEQLQGANYALRILHTSPRIRGAALEMLKDQIEETYEEMRKRAPLSAHPEREGGET